MENQSQKIIGAVLTIMIVVIISAVSALIIGTFLEDTVFENVVQTGSIVNESLGVVTNLTSVTFGIISTFPLTTCSLSSVSNASSGEGLTSGNYTFTASGCTLILTNVSGYVGNPLNASYGYTSDTNVSILGFNVDDLKDDFGLFVTGLIAFLAIIGTIVGIVWLVFYIKQLFDKKSGLQSITA